MDTPSHRVKMPEPVQAITTYTEMPVALQQAKMVKKTSEPNKEDK